MNYFKDFLRRTRAAAMRARMRMLAPLELPEGEVVIVAPHPDDEVLGCGGLIARLCAAGRPPHVVILTRGEGSHRGCCGLSADELGDARHALTLRAAELLGLPLSHLHTFSLPDGGVEAALQSTQAAQLRELLGALTAAPKAALFVPHWGEGWPDHVSAGELVRRMVPTGTQVWEYCVWMWYYNVWRLDWRRGRVLRMTPTEYARKRAAVDAYLAPKAPCGRPWSGVLPPPFLSATTRPRELYFHRSR